MTSLSGEDAFSSQMSVAQHHMTVNELSILNMDTDSDEGEDECQIGDDDISDDDLDEDERLLQKTILINFIGRSKNIRLTDNTYNRMNDPDEELPIARFSTYVKKPKQHESK